MLVHGYSDRHTQEVFRALEDGERARLAAMTLRSAALPPNRDIVAETEIGSGLWLVTSGWAFRYRHTGYGCRQILDFVLPGELIGLDACLLGVMSHSVRSLTAVELTVFDARLVAEAFRSEPSLAQRLARHVAAEARRVEELLSVVGCCGAVERLAFLILSLYRRQKRNGSLDPHDFPFPLRRQHVADALGLTGAHVNRTLNRLKADGVATLGDRRLSIHDLSRLEQIARVGSAPEQAYAAAPA